MRAIVCESEAFKPGDPRPNGYLAWFEWARVQHKAGLRQKRCARCELLHFPQETCRSERRENESERAEEARRK